MGRRWGVSVALLAAVLVVAGCGLGSGDGGPVMAFDTSVPRDRPTTTTVVPPTTVARPTTTTTLPEEAGLHDRPLSPGACVTWDQFATERTDVHVVPCDQPHFMEVVLDDVDLAGQFPPGSAYPDNDGWLALVEQHCRAAVDAYVGSAGADLEPLVATSLKPLAPSWADGYRDMTCTLGLRYRDDGHKQLFAGRAVDIFAGRPPILYDG